MDAAATRDFIDHALHSTGLSMSGLAAELDYKSLYRAYRGEIPLPGSKQKHIETLVELARLKGPEFVEQQKVEAHKMAELEDGGRLREDSTLYSASPPPSDSAYRHFDLPHLISAGKRIAESTPSRKDLQALKEILDELDRRLPKTSIIE